MKYLHTMIRVSDLKETLHFFCEILGFKEVRRYDSEKGRFTLVFLCASSDEYLAEKKSPTIELTYNWPSENAESEVYTQGRNFGHIAYGVEDIYELCHRLVKYGVTINRPPRDGYMAFIKSPDGVSIELLQIGEALKPEEPWLSMENSGSW
jgi:lactoylglutathione lyase